MSWPSKPQDIDLYLSVRTPTNTYFRIFFRNKKSAEEYAVLDRDNQGVRTS